MKALTERCKKHGVEVKSKALVDLPAGTTYVSCLVTYCFRSRLMQIALKTINVVSYRLATWNSRRGSSLG